MRNEPENKFLKSKRLQDLHLQASHPPKIGVEYQNIHALPVFTMLVDRTLPHYSIRYPMDHSIIWVWFQKKWCPVELDRRIILLKKIKQRHTVWGENGEMEKTIKRQLRGREKKKTKQSDCRHLGREDGERIEGFHGFGIFRDKWMKKTDHRNILTSVQGIAHKHHPLPSEGLKHQGRIETVKFFVDPLSYLHIKTNCLYKRKSENNCK